MAKKPAARAQNIRLPRIELPRERLPFVPKNEAGVAVLFGMFASDLKLSISGAQYAFPDCAIRVGRRTIGVELEYRSRSFSTHIKKKQWPKTSCDLIVC